MQRGAANSKLDECRRRVQNETALGHRGHEYDPLYRCRRLLTKADGRLDDRGRTSSSGCSRPVTRSARSAWPVDRLEVVREIYAIADPVLATEFVARLADDLQDRECPPEVRQLGRTIGRWAAQISACHGARAPNGPTEATINEPDQEDQADRVRVHPLSERPDRALLYAGYPYRDLLATVTPRSLKSEAPPCRTRGGRCSAPDAWSAHPLQQDRST